MFTRRFTEELTALDVELILLALKGMMLKMMLLLLLLIMMLMLMNIAVCGFKLRSEDPEALKAIFTHINTTIAGRKLDTQSFDFVKTNLHKKSLHIFDSLS